MGRHIWSAQKRSELQWAAAEKNGRKNCASELMSNCAQFNLNFISGSMCSCLWSREKFAKFADFANGRLAIEITVYKKTKRKTNWKAEQTESRKTKSRTKTQQSELCFHCCPPPPFLLPPLPPLTIHPKKIKLRGKWSGENNNNNNKNKTCCCKFFPIFFVWYPSLCFWFTVRAENAPQIRTTHHPNKQIKEYKNPA